MSRTTYVTICLILFTIAMTGWWFLTRWLVYDVGLWTVIPIGVGAFFIGWLYDRHDQKNGRLGPPSGRFDRWYRKHLLPTEDRD